MKGRHRKSHHVLSSLPFGSPTVWSITDVLTQQYPESKTHWPVTWKRWFPLIQLLDAIELYLKWQRLEQVIVRAKMYLPGRGHSQNRKLERLPISFLDERIKSSYLLHFTPIPSFGSLPGVRRPMSMSSLLSYFPLSLSSLPPTRRDGSFLF